MTALVRRCALKTAGPVCAESTSCGDLREIAAMPRNDDACAPPHVATRRTNLRRIAFYVGSRENAATPCKYPRQPLTSTSHLPQPLIVRFALLRIVARGTRQLHRAAFTFKRARQQRAPGHRVASLTRSRHDV
jgi:hypothetical protein